MPIHVFLYKSISIGPRPLLGDLYFFFKIAAFVLRRSLLPKRNSAIDYPCENKRGSTAVNC